MEFRVYILAGNFSGGVYILIHAPRKMILNNGTKRSGCKAMPMYKSLDVPCIYAHPVFGIHADFIRP